MAGILRLALGVVLGVVAGGLAVLVIELASHAIWPPPAGIDPTNPESIKAAMDQIPLAAKAALVAAWTLGGFLAAFVAGLVAGPGGPSPRWRRAGSSWPSSSPISS